MPVQENAAQAALGVNASPESQLAYFSEHALPTALIDLRNKHGYVNQVIQYCETAYLTNDKAEIEAQTKEYLTDALGAVVKDIELITTNLSAFLDLQAESIASLTPQLDLVKNRIALVKANHAQSRLQRTRRNVVASDPEPMKEALGEDEIAEASKPLPAYERVGLSERLKALDDVGNCLSKG
ncbi:hypothetical protein TeGR_g4250 [Tetraparma gracilis]|jgi:hypothetical protein|uniref:Uncharacterized protein n=1 Tax=Tetraparma gracilis TaxID=2962635 RepID=A0ABQ6N1V8_9STRA|nr:hypothetical protein TeGR_g4250 [Tetraparma gracilis]